MTAVTYEPRQGLSTGMRTRREAVGLQVLHVVFHFAGRDTQLQALQHARGIGQHHHAAGQYARHWVSHGL
ncbi:hypothetical protein D1872_347050 [compost metagenome]